MGDIADMMLDGTLCEGCGVVLHDSIPGFPQRCADCLEPLPPLPVIEKYHVEWVRRKVQCPDCNKHVTEVGLADHRRDKHGR